MISLILGIVGSHCRLKALSIAAISLGSIALTFTITSKGRIHLSTLIKFAFELGGLIFGIIGVL